jgi:putative hemolysin
LRKLLHPALYVPETLPLDRLLEFFQEKETQLALVLDEFGGTEGMVTLEDVVSELVGEIRDEHHRDRSDAIVRRDDGTWLVDGRVPIDDLIEELGLKTPDAAVPRNVTTVAGLVLDQMGRIPNVGDRTHWDSIDLEVIDMDGQRIDRLLVSLPTAEQNGAAEK